MREKEKKRAQKAHEQTIQGCYVQRAICGPECLLMTASANVSQEWSPDICFSKGLLIRRARGKGDYFSLPEKKKKKGQTLFEIIIMKSMAEIIEVEESKITVDNASSLEVYRGTYVCVCVKAVYQIFYSHV